MSNKEHGSQQGTAGTSHSGHSLSLKRRHLPLDRKRWYFMASCQPRREMTAQNRCACYFHRRAESTVAKRIKSVLGTNKNLRIKTCRWVLNKWRDGKKNNILRSGILTSDVRNNEENMGTVRNNPTISRNHRLEEETERHFINFPGSGHRPTR